MITHGIQEWPPGIHQHVGKAEINISYLHVLHNFLSPTVCTVGSYTSLFVCLSVTGPKVSRPKIISQQPLK